MKPTRSRSPFTRFAKWTAQATDRTAAFGVAAVVIVWLIGGPFYGFSDSWQLVSNTAP